MTTIHATSPDRWDTDDGKVVIWRYEITAAPFHPPDQPLCRIRYAVYLPEEVDDGRARLEAAGLYRAFTTLGEALAAAETVTGTTIYTAPLTVVH